MSKISNIFTMLDLLSSGKKYSITELSERIEVSKRMIRHYKEELELAGIYIDTIRGPYGGYILSQNKLYPRGFSKYDIELLELIKDKLGESFPFKKELLDLTDKVNGIYKGSKVKANKVLNTKTNQEIYNILNNAIKNKNKVFINFLSLKNEGKERVIHPCNIFLYNDEFYVSAFCELRGEIRHFAFNRIKDIKLLDEYYDN